MNVARNETEGMIEKGIAMRNTLDYFLDAGGNLWKGPSAMDDNLHYARLEGIDRDGLPIWVLRQSEAEPSWSQVGVLEAAGIVHDLQMAEKAKEQGEPTGC